MIWNLVSDRNFGDIIDRGMIAIDAKIFSEIVRKLPDNEVTIETLDNLQTVITCEKAKFDIAVNLAMNLLTYQLLRKKIL